MSKHRKIVYDADGVPFTIYETIKATKAGLTKYWLLEDYSTGKRRVLNNRTREAAERRADQIRAAMVKGQATQDRQYTRTSATRGITSKTIPPTSL
jgi:hypothetical protein